ncbi:uncharacterized protein LOC133737666 [Rosa rugosa]|uniref:uncharacterized protein LOC133737666 n=1 Tax=Rosa rugosa TaxID=74645 RepID=UPI002B408D7D|nr:uncharacterized protein LOC133737666 [Rosa rugosa]
MNVLGDSLYDVYSSFKTAKELWESLDKKYESKVAKEGDIPATAKELWESLDKKYESKVASAKKFIIGRFLNFKMNDTNSVVKQVEELQIIVHELDDEGMGLNETFLVGSIIEKLPPSWKDFKIYLKHLTEDMNLDELILKLHVEEDHCKNEKYDMTFMEAKTNVVEGSTSKSKFPHNQKKKGKVAAKRAFTALKANTFKKKIQGGCLVCGKPGHRAKD